MKQHKKITKTLSAATRLLEYLISIIILCAVVLLLIELVLQSGIFMPNGSHMDFNTFLSGAFTLVIGVEFTRMLCSHKPDTIVEVLLFAVARQIVITHSEVIETLLGIVAISALFAIRKYLLPKGNKGENDALKETIQFDKG